MLVLGEVRLVVAGAEPVSAQQNQPAPGGIKASILALVLGILALASSVIKPFEGDYRKAYRDPIGILTVCFGHTGSDIVEGKTYTKAECNALLQADMLKAHATVKGCIPRIEYDMPRGVAASLVSFAFNVGGGKAGVKDGVCTLKNGKPPRIRQYANAGDWRAVCGQFQYWAKAGGKTMRGLVRRRAAETAMCMQGL